MADPVIPAAPATPAVPAAPAVIDPAAPAAPATPAVNSLLDAGTPAAPVVDPAAAPAAPVVPPVVETEWFYADGVKGTGAPPEWLKTAKYKSVDEQAKAYGELEKRFGTFKGAPKDGKYEFKMPEGVEGELDQTNPLMQGFNKWATEKQLSAEGYQELMGMFVEYEASLAPNMGEIKKALGDNADARIGSVATWAKANLDAASYEQLREATSGANAAAVFGIIEATIAKTRQPAAPKIGADVASIPSGMDAIKVEEQKRGPDGKFLFLTDPAHRRKVEQMRTNLLQSQQAA